LFKSRFLGGEKINTKYLRPIIDHQLNFTVINTYGPTECSDLVATYTLTDDDIINEATVPVGKQVPNVRVYILDEHLEDVKAGEIGELYIGGVGVGRGYVANVNDNYIFKPDTKGYAIHEEKIYRTGDLVKMLENNLLAFIGRKDTQIKLRGYRIELAEIEKVLLSMETINHCIVLSKDFNDCPYITAYYTAEQPLEEKIVKHYLAERLPNYMVPSFIVYIEKFPMNLHGKIDISSLSNPV